MEETTEEKVEVGDTHALVQTEDDKVDSSQIVDFIGLPTVAIGSDVDELKEEELKYDSLKSCRNRLTRQPEDIIGRKISYSTKRQ